MVSHKIKLTLKSHVTYHGVRQNVWLCNCPRNLSASPPSYCGLVVMLEYLLKETLLVVSQRKEVAEREEGELNLEQNNNIPH